MKKLENYTKKFCQYFDMFPATQFLRYKQSGDYRTVTGGCLSIGIIVIFIILFYSQGVQTINQQIIYSSISYQMEVDPDPLTVTFTKGAEFMFAVGIQYVDLSNTSKRYFNVSLRQNHYGPLFSNNTYISIPLIPCTTDHFSYSSDIMNYYLKLNLSKSLCPPLNVDLTVGGRLVSDFYSQYTVNIQYCNKTIDSSCATDAQVQALQDQYGGFTLFVPTINTVVNPGDQIYKQVYVQQRNYYFFTTTAGLWLNGQIQLYQVDTDTSLLPTQNIESQYFITIPDLFIMKPQPIYNGLYVQIIFSKSGILTTFTRGFDKVDAYFSYVGGLVGTILMLFFFMRSYSQASYVLSLASQIYTFSEDKSQPQSFNFLYYIATSLIKVLNKIKIDLPWYQPTKFLEIMQQMDKQLNVSYLLKRISFIDQAITSILNQHQIESLYLNQRKSIKLATKKRKKSSLSKVVTQGKDQINNQSNGFGTSQIILPQQIENTKNEFGIFQQMKNISNLDIISQENQIQSWASDQKSQKQEIANKLKDSLIKILINRHREIQQAVEQSIKLQKEPSLRPKYQQRKEVIVNNRSKVTKGRTFQITIEYSILIKMQIIKTINFNKLID